MEVIEGIVPNHLFDLYTQCVTNHSLDKEAQAHEFVGRLACEMIDGSGALWFAWLQDTLGQDPRQVGRFWFSSTLQRARWEQLHVIEPYYSDERIEQQLLPLINKREGAAGSKRVSLRVLDWLVTNFSKKNRIIYTLQDPGGKQLPFNLYLQYKSSLNRYKRHVFDPFRRHRRVYFIHKQHMYSTTVGQLNFMHWAFEHRIIEYAQSRMAEIEADMTQCIKENQRDKEQFKKKGKKRCRKPLCKIVPRKCFLYSLEENVMFVQPPLKKIKLE